MSEQERQAWEEAVLCAFKETKDDAFASWDLVLYHKITD